MIHTPTQAVFAALLRQQFSAFIAKAYQVVCPGQRFLPNWHLDVIADYLARCARREYKRLLITMPPRSLKSICASVAFPAWLLGLDPTLRLICASYSSDLATKHARDCRVVMESEWYPEVFPGTRLLRSAEVDLETTRKGGRYATSVGGTLTGRGGQFIIIDDPLKPQEASSKATREHVKQWYDGTVYSRLDNKATDVIIVVMQRLHVDDFIAHVLEKESWVHLDLPAIAEFDESFALSDGRVLTRARGEVLHPDREPYPVLQTIQQTMGSFHFSAQYQQRPVAEEGNLVKWKWFQRYDTPPAFGREDRIVQSWDTASKATELADYSVCTTWHQKKNVYYLLDVFRARLDYPDLIKAVINHGLKWRVHTILIEDAGSGIALIQQIRDERIDNFPRPIGIKPQGDKVMRLSTHSATIQAGHVHIPRQAPWLEEYKSEFLAFPQCRYDDQVDSVSQFLTWQVERHRNTMSWGYF